MNNRIFDFSDSPAKLRVAGGVLEARVGEEPPRRVRFEEIAVIIAAHPQISFTQQVLNGLSEHGALLIGCDGKRLPSSMMLPLQSHSLLTERFARQAAVKAPLKKRLWQQIVRAKILAQGRTLERAGGKASGFAALAKQVRSGDPANVEARAARRYWPRLMGEEFRRDPNGSGANSLLNYGYAVLRAIIARAICASGLHPALGLHHHNRYNAFCLADDLMEPFRPLVDAAVFRHLKAGGSHQLDRTAKGELLEALGGRCLLEGEQRSLFECAERLAGSLWSVFAGEARRLTLPEDLELVEHAAP